MLMFHLDKRDNDVQGKHVWFKINSNGGRRSNAYMQAPFKKKILSTDISIL